MGDITMTCGHKAVGDEWKQGWWWKDWEGGLSCGCLCDRCAPIYRAVQAKNFEEARELLKDDSGVTLQDICANMEGATRRTEQIDGFDWDIVEL